jgi:phosphotriesterase-related protein
MPTVNTVLGPVETADLGFTLSHEHVGTNAAGLRHTYPEFLDRSGLLEQAVAAMREAYQAGVRTMVEVTTFDLGREVGLIQEVSGRSGVQLIAATGNHLAVPRPFGEVSPDVIARLYIREIEEEIEGTGIKAGIIKVASDRGGVTPPQEVILRAAARTHHRTGVPISTHTWSPDRVGDQQVRILEEEGVDLHRVYIGHSNDDTDLGYLLGLLERGVWLGMDRRACPRYTRLGTTDRHRQATHGRGLQPSPHAVPRLLRPQSPLWGGGAGGAPPGEPRWLYVHLQAGAAPSPGAGRLRPRHPPDHGGEPASVL